MTIIKDDIILKASYRALLNELLRRRARVQASLSTLKKFDSLYANEHRRLEELYTALIQVTHEHIDRGPAELSEDERQRLAAQAETEAERGQNLAQFAEDAAQP